MNGYVQIPKNIIKDSRLKSNDFLMVVWLKYLMYVSGENVKVEIGKIKEKLGLIDTRTIKKIFEKLMSVGIIKNFEMGRFYVEIKTDREKMNDKPFAQLPVKVLDYVKEIGSTGIRLLYYYESHINRGMEKEFCYASIRTIVKDTGLADKTVKSYNDVLVKKRLLKIIRHELKDDGYDEEDNEIWNKYNNHYYVRVDNM